MSRKFIESWEVKDDDYFRQNLIYIRHYFPAVNIEELTDEEFAILANDAAWFDAHQIKIAQTNTIAALTPSAPPKK